MPLLSRIKISIFTRKTYVVAVLCGENGWVANDGCGVFLLGVRTNVDILEGETFDIPFE